MEWVINIKSLFEDLLQSDVTEKSYEYIPKQINTQNRNKF